MGGFGSGRWRNHVRKPRVDECMALDLRHTKVKALLARDRAEGTLDWSDPRSGDSLGWADFLLTSVNPDGSRNLVLDRTGDEYLDKEVIALGLRPAGFCSLWFAGCRGCGKAVRTLFALTQNDLFRCRICSDLTYASVQSHDSRLDQAIRDPDGFLLARHQAPATPHSELVTSRLIIRAIARQAEPRRGRGFGRRSTTSWTRAIDELRADFERRRGFPLEDMIDHVPSE